MEKTISEKRIEIFEKSRRYKYKDNFSTFMGIYSKYAGILTPDEFDNAVNMIYSKHQEKYFESIAPGKQEYFEELKATCNSDLEEALKKISEDKKSRLARIISKDQMRRR